MAWFDRESYRRTPHQKQKYAAMPPSARLQSHYQTKSALAQSQPKQVCSRQLQHPHPPNALPSSCSTSIQPQPNQPVPLQRRATGTSHPPTLCRAAQIASRPGGTSTHHMHKLRTTIQNKQVRAKVYSKFSRRISTYDNSIHSRIGTATR